MARRKPSKVHGTMLIDKPAGMTSHDVVGGLRRRLNERRIGHAGTLDPDATGLLVVGIGNATRLLRFATATMKRYETEIVFGVSTTTLDAAGDVTATFDMSGLDESEVAAAALRLTGDIDQVPPMVSAIKVGGRRLHELAREGVEVEREPRRVHVAKFEVEPIGVDEVAGAERPIYRAVVECSAGTYIRSLVDDLGTELGGGAHLRSLRRTRSGSFDVAEGSVGTIDEAPVLAIRELVRGMDEVVVDADRAVTVGHGVALSDDEASGDGPWAVIGPDGDLLAVHERDPERGGRIGVGVVLPNIDG